MEDKNDHPVENSTPAPTPQSNETMQPQAVAAPMLPSKPKGPKFGFLDGAVDLKSVESTPVVMVWSIRGVEYAIMSFMLWAIAISLTWVLVALVNGETGFVTLSGPASLLLVSLPFFAVFMLRLKKAELADATLRTESTKRKFSQITQIVSFFVVFFALVSLVAGLLSSVGGQDVELGSLFGTTLSFIFVWSLLFIYYWRDEHKAAGK